MGRQMITRNRDAISINNCHLVNSAKLFAAVE